MLLKAIAVTQMPLVYFIYINNKSEIRGNLLDFPKILQKYANISYKIPETPAKNGWNGMMTTLAKNEADISLTPIVQSERAMNLVNFSKTIYFSSYVILSKSNQYKAITDLIDHILKIEFDIWLLLFSSIITILLVFHFDPANKFHLSRSEIWHITNVIFVQNLPFKLYLSASTFLITLFSLFYSMLFISINALIGVTIVVVPHEKQINSMEDILSTESTLPAIYKSTSLETLLSISNDPVHQKLWNLVKSRPDLCLRTVPDHINGESPGHNQNFYDALSRGKVATFEPDYYSDLIIYDYCRYVPSMRWHRSPPIESLELRFAFGIRKGLDQNLFKTINNFIERLIQAGLINKWFVDDYALAQIFDGKPPPECIRNTSDNESEYIPIKISNMKQFSRILFVMHLISYLLLITEIWKFEFISKIITSLQSYFC